MVVAVDYFTIWIKVEPLVFISGRQIINFLLKNILTRFGTPRVFISDNRLHCAENPFKSWCIEKHIEQRFTSVVQRQTNGYTEVSKMTPINEIKNRLGTTRAIQHLLGGVQELEN